MNSWIYEQPAAFANVISGFSLGLFGLFLLILNQCLSRFFPPQPIRWQWLYVALFITGIPTGLYHGWGETPLLRTIDLSSNLVLSWIGLYAVSHDRHMGGWVYFTIWVLLGINVCAIVGRFIVGGDLGFLTFSSWGGFFVSELLLVVQGLFTIAVHSLNFRWLPPPAQPLCVLTISLFILGTSLSTASNQQIVWDLLPIHALWHFVAVLAFAALWMYNFVRFSVVPVAIVSSRSPHLEAEPISPTLERS